MACGWIHSRVWHQISSQNRNCGGLGAPVTADAGRRELYDLSGIAGIDEHYNHAIRDSWSATRFGIRTRSTAGSFVEASTTTGLQNCLPLHRFPVC